MGTYDTRGGTPRHDPAADHEGLPVEPADPCREALRRLVERHPRKNPGPAYEHAMEALDSPNPLPALVAQLETFRDRLTDGRRGLTPDMAAEWVDEIDAMMRNMQELTGG